MTDHLERLEAVAARESMPAGLTPDEIEAVWDDAPDVTWAEMAEIVALLREAADALRAAGGLPTVTDDWLADHLQPRGVCDRRCRCEDCTELRRGVWGHMNHALPRGEPGRGAWQPIATLRARIEQAIHDGMFNSPLAALSVDDCSVIECHAEVIAEVIASALHEPAPPADATQQPINGTTRNPIGGTKPATREG